MTPLFFAKVLVSAVILAVASEVAKKDTFWGALIVALPLTSVLAMLWLYADTRDDARVAAFARDILMLVPVSLVLFIPFVLEKKTHWGFAINLGTGLALLVVAVVALRRWLS